MKKRPLSPGDVRKKIGDCLTLAAWGVLPICLFLALNLGTIVYPLDFLARLLTVALGLALWVYLLNR